MFTPDCVYGSGGFGSVSGAKISDYYPGAAYMGNPGYIGCDYYPSAGAPNFNPDWLTGNYSGGGVLGSDPGWNFDLMLAVAKANGHGLCIGEWGCQGNDDPTAQTDMLTWTVNTAMPQLNGKSCLYIMWNQWYGSGLAPPPDGTESGSWDLFAFSDVFNAVKSAFAVYQASGLIPT